MVRPSLLPEATDDVLGEPSLVGVQAVDCVLRGDAGFAVRGAPSGAERVVHGGVRRRKRPGVRLAVMNSITSGWSMRSTPIWAPRRAPALSTVAQDWSNTLM